MENSKIAWTDHTFNPWIGCTKVSPGCANCYAETMMDKRFKRVKWGPEGERVRTSQKNWSDVWKWNMQAEESGKRKRVFVASLADFFEARPELDEWRNEAIVNMGNYTGLDFLILTKRPQYVAGMMNMNSGYWPKNIWVGTSVENDNYIQRIFQLGELPTRAKTFVSAEPLIGPLHLNGIDGLIDWLIVGGESGNDKQRTRPMNPGWARALRDWAQEHNIPFFMKQMGAWIDGEWRGGHGDGDSIPPDLRIQQTPFGYVEAP